MIQSIRQSGGLSSEPCSQLERVKINEVQDLVRLSLRLSVGNEMKALLFIFLAIITNELYLFFFFFLHYSDLKQYYYTMNYVTIDLRV